MNNKSYMNELKEELDSYKEKLSELKDAYKGQSKKDFEIIYQSLERILEKAKLACKNLESASVEEWEPLKKIAAQSFNELKQSFEEVLNNSSNKLKDYTNKLEVMSKDELGVISDYIKDNPLKSTLLALTLGIIVGKIIK